MGSELETITDKLAKLEVSGAKTASPDETQTVKPKTEEVKVEKSEAEEPKKEIEPRAEEPKKVEEPKADDSGKC